MKLILTAVDDALAEAWQLFCGEFEFVSVHRGSILEVSCDAFISPANSFGFMDGGVDAVYANYFGTGLQGRIQEMIAARHDGELLVGMADLVETGHDRIPYLIVAPTMRVPMVLTGTVNAFLAARAIFLLLKNGRFPSGRHTGEPIHRHIHSLALPGLGTGVGQLGPNTCAYQVRAAIEDVVLNQATPPRTWADASERHQRLYTTRPRRLQQ